ncbi:NAD(P)H-dependent oxidoreductase [Planctobacterium marinum]|uniref:NAD(P)H-dependent oxidoreductase n=1 Tax=Planctobacterium marinum TaxID=1631968 RepID=UPI001E58D10B|nr:NAD(P)H-dependent oxidoreductase [Planctobacterium marinum]MCC2605745.1 NAD(P)H-dependent oxidoreductase [Planctobacterium marinum]
MSIIEDLEWRYAVREFSDEVIPQEDIDELVEAVRLTPSSYGLQPYKLLVIKDQSIKSKLLAFSMGQTKARDCSHLFVFASQMNINDEYIDTHFQLTEKIRQLQEGTTNGFKQHVKDAILGMSENDRKHWADQQAFIALGNLLTVAATKRIDACPMGGFEAEGYDKILNLKEKGLRSVVICTLGYRSNADTSALSPKVREPLNSFCITN